MQPIAALLRAIGFANPPAEIAAKIGEFSLRDDRGRARVPHRRTRQYLPGGLLINALEILRVCRVARVLARCLQRTRVEMRGIRHALR